MNIPRTQAPEIEGKILDKCLSCPAETSQSMPDEEATPHVCRP